MNPTGYVFYRGPSMIDGAPVVGIVTLHSDNVKTGDMLQSWILRADVAPHDAVKTGEDAAICGNCPHRGGTCYVLTFQGPLAIWRAFRAERYPVRSLADVLAEHGRPARMGAYGDPAAIPSTAWDGIEAHRRTGYTHRWRDESAAWLRPLAMASVDSWAELETAEREGWRAFYVLPEGAPLPDRSPAGRRIVACPAVTHGITCDRCRLCDGMRQGPDDARPHVALWVHGRGAAGFTPPTLALT